MKMTKELTLVSLSSATVAELMNPACICTSQTSIDERLQAYHGHIPKNTLDGLK
ncbi:hypothetical protein HanLR1_Chr03g0086601 [Helianthus annuus]|nr:hypothetical protein HanLR1_Chr03g0086601 [Helianthus annuus]